MKIEFAANKIFNKRNTKKVIKVTENGDRGKPGTSGIREEQQDGKYNKSSS